MIPKRLLENWKKTFFVEKDSIFKKNVIKTQIIFILYGTDLLYITAY